MRTSQRTRHALWLAALVTATLVVGGGCGSTSRRGDALSPDVDANAPVVPSASTILVECATDTSFATPVGPLRVGDRFACRIVLLSVPSWASSYLGPPALFRWQTSSIDGGALESGPLEAASWHELPSYGETTRDQLCQSQGGTRRPVVQDCQTVCCRIGDSMQSLARAACAEAGGTLVDPLWRCTEIAEGSCHVFDGTGETPLFVSTQYCEWGFCGIGKNVSITREDQCAADSGGFVLAREDQERVCCRLGSDGSYLMLAQQPLLFLESVVELRATAPGSVTIGLRQETATPVPFVESSPGSSQVTLTISN